MEPALLGQIAGLALLDALNPATIAVVALVLVGSVRRPRLTALVFAVGAFAVVLALGLLMLTGATAAADLVAGATTWVRRAALGLAALLLLVAAVRRLRDRDRAQVGLPSWVGPWTAAPLGVLVTGADLPNAFPYLVAVERLVAAQVPPGPAALVLAGYALVYVGPCLLLVLVSSVAGARARGALAGLVQRFGRARVVRRSWRAALLLAAAAAGLVALALVV